MKRFLAIGVLAAIPLLAVTPTAVADEHEPASGSALTEISAYVEPSVVYIQTQYSGSVWDRTNKQYLNDGEAFTWAGQCTGYVVNPSGYIATAGHCIDRKGTGVSVLQETAAQWAIDNAYYASSDLTIEDILGFGSFQVVGEDSNRLPDMDVTAAWSQSAGGVETGKALPARVISAQSFETGDGALLKVEATDLAAIPLAEDAELGVGTEVVAVGYPGSVDTVADASFSPSYKEGTISSEKTMGNGLSKAYEISAATSGGMSGGPVVNLDGEVVGFVSFKPATETQSFNFIRPADAIKELLGGAGVDNELGEISTNYRAGLDAYFAGDKAAAIESLQAVVDDQPTNTMANEYLSKAKDLPDPAPAADSSSDSGGFPILWVAIGGAVLLLAGVGAALMMRKRGGRTTSPAAGQPVPAGGAQAQTPTAPPVTVSAPPAPMSAPPPPAPAAPQPSEPPRPAEPVGAPSAAASPTGRPMATSSPEAIPSQSRPTESSLGFTSPHEREASTSVETKEVFCTTCGTRGKPGQRFCGNCGSSIS